ncbi:uncharacterized protein TNCT_5981 [Trichonephila clavata]|uniref:Uncharacterized protein n=1 Tax=Trichonephila clavata TaxID=2740835 RepID=A0A8X6FZ58_TRICU|nr:uncharacterized protein TNCT_5981 [Trichonephila clavata]
MQLRKTFLSLQQMCLSKVAIAVFKDPEVKSFIEIYGVHSCIWPSEETEIFLGTTPDTLFRQANTFAVSKLNQRNDVSEFQVSEGKVPLIGHVLPNKQWEILLGKKVSTFRLPELIQKEIMALVRLIVLEVDKWLEDHARIPMSITSTQISFHWTQDAKIDRVKTAKELIANNVISVKDRFLLGCQYCFEDDVALLWGMLSGLQQVVFQEVRFGIARFWANWLRGVSPLDWEGIARTSECNPFGLRSFFPHLNEVERFNWLLVAVRRRGIEYNELQFCLQKLNENQQTELIKECPLQILEMFLEWPVQGELVDVVDLLWPYLSVHEFHDILNLILSQKIIPGSKDFNYIPIIRELWEKSPSRYKDFIRVAKLYNNLKLVIEYDRFRCFPHSLLIRSNDGSSLMFRSADTMFLICKKKDFFRNFRFPFHYLLNKCRRISVIYFSEN